MRQLLPAILGVATLISLGTAAITIAGTIPNISGVLVAQKLNCNNPQTQVDMNTCAGLSYQQADRKLNQVYQQLQPKLERSRRQKLITAQQAWLKFQDTNCTFERSEVEGGTMAPMIYSGCLATVTKQRTAQLEEYLRDLK